MIQKRIMIVGPTNCGKSSLARILEEDSQPLRRAPEVIYGKRTIDCPGAYIENSRMYQHLIALSQDAFCILIMVDQTRPIEVYPPNFAKSFTKPVIGVVTKVDACLENRGICQRQLERIGAGQMVFYISCHNGEGILGLKNYLFQQWGRGGNEVPDRK